MVKHYKIGGSTFERSFECPGWQVLAERLPRAQTSGYAERGTMLHDVAEQMVLEDKDPREFLGYTHRGEDGIDYVVGEDEIDALVQAKEAFTQLCDQYDIDIFDTEVTLEHSEHTGGTADIIAIGEKHFIIADWKFGKGIQVEAVNNAQLLFYIALAAKDPKTSDLLQEFVSRNGVEKGELLPDKPLFAVAIIQPNEQGLDVLRTYEYTTKDIRRALDVINQTEELIIESKSESLKAGNHCKFCPAAATCPVKTGEARKALMLDPKSAEFKQLGKALDMVGAIEEWARAVRKAAHEQATLGNKIPGWKLVNKRATRKWSDAETAEKKLKASKSLVAEDYQKTDILSPAQLEKVCKRKKVDFEPFTAYIESVSTGTTMAPDADPRSAVLDAKVFSDLADRLS